MCLGPGLDADLVWQPESVLAAEYVPADHAIESVARVTEVANIGRELGAGGEQSGESSGLRFGGEPHLPDALRPGEEVVFVDVYGVYRWPGLYLGGCVVEAYDPRVLPRRGYVDSCLGHLARYSVSVTRADCQFPGIPQTLTGRRNTV